MSFRAINSLAISAALLSGLVFQLPVFAQTLTSDQLLKQVESSGALDKAVERSFERLRQKSIAAQQLEQEKQQKQKLQLAKNARKVDPKIDFIYGNSNATISIIEYSDFECPYCQKFSDTPIELAKEMPNQVNVVWRNFPLQFHNPVALIEASAAICVGKQGGNDIFWKFVDAVFKKSRLNGQGIPVEGGQDPLLKLAKSYGLNAEKFEECISSAEVQKLISNDIQDGVSAGINGTPGVILVNHKTGKVDVMAGAVPIEFLREAVKGLLAK